jgi:hypothetical protein
MLQVASTGMSCEFGPHSRFRMSRSSVYFHGAQKRAIFQAFRRPSNELLVDRLSTTYLPYPVIAFAATMAMFY